MRISFKKNKPTGSRHWLEKPFWRIKIDGRCVGNIYCDRGSDTDSCYWVIAASDNLLYVNTCDKRFTLEECKAQAKEYIKTNYKEAIAVKDATDWRTLSSAELMRSCLEKILTDISKAQLESNCALVDAAAKTKELAEAVLIEIKIREATDAD